MLNYNFQIMLTLTKWHKIILAFSSLSVVSLLMPQPHMINNANKTLQISFDHLNSKSGSKTKLVPLICFYRPKFHELIGIVIFTE